MLLSYKWDRDRDGDRDRKSLCGATIRASLCDANKINEEEKQLLMMTNGHILG